MTTKKSATEDFKTCICCGEVKSCKSTNNKFYSHRNKLINDKFSICKECVEKIGLEDNMADIHLLLRTMDLPFIPEKWEDCTSQENTLTAYMGNKGINLPKVKYDNKVIMDMNYVDSPNFSEIQDVEKYITNTNEVIREYKRRWGKNWAIDDYEDMELDLVDMIKQYGDNNNDYATKNTYINIILTKKLMLKAYEENDLGKGKDLSARLSQLMKEANLQVIDQKNKDDEFRLGVEIDYAEDEPIIENPFFKDLDRFEFYWKTFIVKHFARFIGLDKSKVINDLEEMEKYDELNNKNGDVDGN